VLAAGEAWPDAAPEADRRTLAAGFALEPHRVAVKPRTIEAFVNDTARGLVREVRRGNSCESHWGEHRGVLLDYWLYRRDTQRQSHSTTSARCKVVPRLGHPGAHENKPFDTFTVEHSPATSCRPHARSRWHAVRATITTNEGGIIDEE